MRKWITILMILCFACSFAPGIAFADGDIMAKVEASRSGESIASEIKTIASGFVDFVRGIFAVVAVVFVIWAGFVIWGASGDPNRMMQAKKLLAGFLICLIVVYAAETIVGGVLGILGYGG